MGIYDLFDVSIGGEIISARPIDWSGTDAGDGVDSDGISISVLKYHGTCPKCAQLVEFTPDEIVDFGDVAVVICENCGAGPSEAQVADHVSVQHIITPDKYTFSDNQAVLTSGNEPKPASDQPKLDSIIVKAMKEDCPFQDPVKAGELRLAKT